MADADFVSDRKRDRVKRRMRRYVRVPLSVRTGDLPKRATSAAVMLAVAGGALWVGGLVFNAFVAIVAIVAIVEFARLALRATARSIVRMAAIALGAAYVGIAAALLATMPRFYLILVIGSVICTDTFAYFAGRTIGGPKIAPAISPSKTWAGLAGGMAGSAMFGTLFLAWLIGNRLDLQTERYLQITMLPWTMVGAIVIGAVLAIAAQSGDFFESWLKRRAHMKDSSNLIPGHGGIFDRIDGMLPVAIIVGMLGPSIS